MNEQKWLIKKKIVYSLEWWLPFPAIYFRINFLPTHKIVFSKGNRLKSLHDGGNLHKPAKSSKILEPTTNIQAKERHVPASGT